MPSSKKHQDIREQYHHYIPRFVLRYFQVGVGVRKTKKERRMEHWKAKKDPTLEAEKVLFYDTSSRILSSRPIGSVYGVIDLYKDAKNTENVYHIEEMFSRLESDAAAFAKKLHENVTISKEIAVTRKELGIFRKFLFLMYARASCLSSTYLKEDHPENARIKDWIKKRKQDKGLDNDVELWLDSMQYRLERPHHILVAEGEAIIERLGGRLNARKTLRTRIDPDINHYAVEYESIANAYSTGICEAADGAEFVSGSSSFGLWEGTLFGEKALHRLYVLSPQLVVILRGVLEAQIASTVDNHFVDSTLISIPLEFAKIRHASFNPEGSISEEDMVRKLAEYRVSDAAQKDLYTFKVAKLTKGQTQAVNEVVLLHVRHDQAVTFASKGCMLDTLQAYYKSDDRCIRQNRHKYNALLRVLQSYSVQDIGAGNGFQ